MRGPAEYLHGKSRLDAARALFQKPNVLLFRFANAAERSSEANADPVLWLIVRIFETGIIERQLCRRDRKLSVTIEPLQSVRRNEFFRVPVIDLSCDANTESAHVEAGNWTDAGFLGQNSFPKIFDAFADASNRTETGDDNATATHAVTLLARASTYAFIQRNVLLATLPIKKSPIIGFIIGATAGMRKLSSCEISTRTPSGVSSNVHTTCMPLVNAFR